MVEIPKVEDVKKHEGPPAVIMSSSQVKPEDVIIEKDEEVGAESPKAVAPRKPKDDILEQMRKDMESAQLATKEANARTAAAERERDAAKAHVETTKTELAKSGNEKVAAQEAAIQSKVDAAKAEVENAERALEEAIDTGKPAKEQIRLQKMLAESVYKLKGAEGAKTHFDNWKEKEKSKPAAVVQEKTAGQKWIDDHPRFNTDREYKRVAINAHSEALVDGITEGSDEYFRRINEAVKGLDGKISDIPSPTPKPVSSGTSTAAPVSQDSTGAGASGGRAAEEHRTGQRKFKLDTNMQQMAKQIYGKGTKFNLSDDEAYRKYAAKRLEINDKRANGEI
jgi:hypothetical protein